MLVKQHRAVRAALFCFFAGGVRAVDRFFKRDIAHRTNAAGDFQAARGIAGAVFGQKGGDPRFARGEDLFACGRRLGRSEAQVTVRKGALAQFDAWIAQKGLFQIIKQTGARFKAVKVIDQMKTGKIQTEQQTARADVFLLEDALRVFAEWLTIPQFRPPPFGILCVKML